MQPRSSAPLKSSSTGRILSRFAEVIAEEYKLPDSERKVPKWLISLAALFLGKAGPLNGKLESITSSKEKHEKLVTSYTELTNLKKRDADVFAKDYQKINQNMKDFDNKLNQFDSGLAKAKRELISELSRIFNIVKAAVNPKSMAKSEPIRNEMAKLDNILKTKDAEKAALEQTNRQLEKSTDVIIAPVARHVETNKAHAFTAGIAQQPDQTQPT